MGGVTQKMTDTVKSTVPSLTSTGIQAVAVLTDPSNGQVYGQVNFTQDDNGVVTVTGEVKNIPDKQKRGFHIHEFGDTTNGCTSAGAHYNPDNNEHAGPQDQKRHIGDLGNIVGSSGNVAKISIKDSVIQLTGPRSIIGRTVVLHEKEDDLGRGSNAESKKTGNAGGRVACGVIGYKRN